MSASPPVEWTVERLHDRLVAATFTASDAQGALESARPHEYTKKSTS